MVMASTNSQHIQFSSARCLKFLWISLRILGLHPLGKFKFLYYCYSVFINISVTIGFNLSLFIYIFNYESKKDLISNLAQLSGSLIVSFKILNTYLKRDKLFEVRKLFAKLDSCITGDDEREYFEYIFKIGRGFFLVFSFMCGIAGLVCDFPGIFDSERRLSYPASLPWDWRSSRDVTCDTYPATLLWLLKGHLHALGMRVRKIGWNKEQSKDENYRELRQCIQEHQTCFKVYQLCCNINSRVMLLQFICTQIILCTTALYLIFYIDDVYKSTYLVGYFACMVLEITFCCFCGTELIEESLGFTEALYNSNWMDQNSKFKQVLIIAMENTQTEWINYAGGIISISLTTWVTVLKSAYSLFAVFGRSL